MTKIMTCIDGSAYAASVCDHAAWAARRIDAPVEVVRALGPRELAELDRQKAKVGSLRGHQFLGETAARLRAAGVAEVEEKLRHGDVADTIRDLDGETRLVVIGKRGEAADFAQGHLSSNMERVARASSRPVPVASRAFKPIERVLVAFDDGRRSGGPGG